MEGWILTSKTWGAGQPQGSFPARSSREAMLSWWPGQSLLARRSWKALLTLRARHSWHPLASCRNGDKSREVNPMQFIANNTYLLRLVL